MSVEMACYCDELPAHSHVYAFVLADDLMTPLNSDGSRDTLRKVMQRADTGEIRIWVDWKAVARAALSGDPT